MARKKNPDNNYFNENVENAIIQYNSSTDEHERNKLFKIIYPAIAKISEVWYNKIKPTYMEGDVHEAQMDCISFMLEKFPMLQRQRGKSFSYLTVTARNFYIYKNTIGYRDTVKRMQVVDIEEDMNIRDDDGFRSNEMKNIESLNGAFADYLENNIDKLASNKSRKSAPVIMEVVKLMRNVDAIDNFNRRDIMNALVTIDGKTIDRHYITKIFNKITTHYLKFRKVWNETGKPMPYWEKEYLTPEEIEFCINNYEVGHRQLGIIGLAKNLNVEEYTVRKELFRVGLCSL
jgi:hypothetical protein